MPGKKKSGKLTLPPEKYSSYAPALIQNYASKHVRKSQIYKGDPRPDIPPRVMASSAMGLKLGVYQILPTTHTHTHTKANANKMHPRSLCAVQRFTRVYLHAQTTAHTHLMNHDYFDCRRNPKTPNLNSMPG